MATRANDPSVVDTVNTPFVAEWLLTLHSCP